MPAGATFFVRTRGWACSEPGEPRKGTKVLLKFTEGKHRGQTSHIDVTKLVPVLHSSRPSPAGRALVLCQETVPFRHVARCQISSSDVVVELGCSFGEMTSVLLERTAHVIGVDHASSVLEAAARRSVLQRQGASSISKCDLVVEVVTSRCFSESAPLGRNVRGADSENGSS